MNKSIILCLMIGFVFFQSCKKDETSTEQTTYEYHAHVHAPTTDQKKMGDLLEIEVTFESHAGQPVHHINIVIKEKTTGNIIYNKPNEAHIHATEGMYEYIDTLELSEANGFKGHTDYVFVARVWGEKEGAGEVSETVEFHVHPN